MSTALTGPGGGVPDALVPSSWERLLGRVVGSPRRVFWFGFLAMLLVTSCWVVGNPLIASVDEASHATKAAATVRGQWVPDTEGQSAGVGVAEVPELFEDAIDLQYCIAFQPDTPASCQPELTGDLDDETEVLTTAAAYNPLYYAVVGVPSLLPVGEHTLYLMRFMSAVLGSLLFAVALRTVAEVRRSHWLVLGVVAALTPMVLYLTSAVNPQTTEVMGALALWVCLLTTLRYPDPALLTRRLARIALVGAFFVNSRGISPLFLVCILVAVLVAVPWRSVVDLVRDRRSWPWIGLAAVASVAAAAWILLAGALPQVEQVLNPELVGLRVVKTTLGETSYYLQSMIGVFGWLDTPLPGWLYYVFAGVVGLVVGLALAVGRRRVLLAMAGTALVVLVLPVVVQLAQAKYLGFIWQGRYMLPLALGIPVLAGFAVQDRLRDLPSWVARRVLRLVVLVAAGGHFVAFGVNLHRYVNGAQGEWTGWDAESWLPPVQPWVLLAVYAVAWAAVAAVLLAAADAGPAAGLGEDARSGASNHADAAVPPTGSAPDAAVPPTGSASDGAPSDGPASDRSVPPDAGSGGSERLAAPSSPA
ncbi:DUF2142 domain-containing protein [Cellulomonas sp. 179-A 4D5 NHS]|uniref:DUF2142 domain-containing protein n=1 Tax=Cellulomonas sp. 179-A 4D5 NHS TaxID=3142378 RepID=UPI00399F8777